jgi:hypothetical protein
MFGFAMTEDALGLKLVILCCMATIVLATALRWWTGY